MVYKKNDCTTITYRNYTQPFANVHRPFRVDIPYKNARSVAIIILIIIILASNGDTSADRFEGGKQKQKSKYAR